MARVGGSFRVGLERAHRVPTSAAGKFDRTSLLLVEFFGKRTGARTLLANTQRTTKTKNPISHFHQEGPLKELRVRFEADSNLPATQSNPETRGRHFERNVCRRFWRLAPYSHGHSNLFVGIGRDTWSSASEMNILCCPCWL